MAPNRPHAHTIVAVVVAFVTCTLLVVVPTDAQKGKPYTPTGLNISFVPGDPATGPETVNSDGAPFDGFGLVNGVVDGAFLNSVGGLELRLVLGPPDGSPAGTPDRWLSFDFDHDVPPGSPAACTLPSGPVHTVNLRFNVQDDRGRTLGIEALPVGTTVQGGNGGAYDVGAIFHFTPDDSSADMYFMIGREPAVTLKREEVNRWTVTVDTFGTAGLALRCAIPLGKRVSTYELGSYQAKFSLDVIKP